MSSETGDFVFSLRTPLPNNEGTLQLLSCGFVLSSIFFTALELDLFEQLERGPGSSDQLAARMGTPQPSLERLLIALLALGLIKRDEAGVYSNSPLTLALTSRGPAGLAPALLEQKRHFYDLFSHLTEAVKSARPQIRYWPFLKKDEPTEDCYSVLARYPEEYALFLQAMDHGSLGVGKRIAEQVDFSAIHRLIDLGGGGGQVVRELAEAVPHLSLVLFDLEEACRFARERIQASGLTGRVQCVPGSLLDDLRGALEPADAVLLSGVISDFDAEGRRRILENARALLRPGGRLLVSETLFNAERSGPLMPALLSLYMLVGTRGNNFSPAEIRLALEEAGFDTIELFSNQERGLRDLIVARRP
jgi:3-hydroxy-5-methyl-1-naphthoate 3-O-methyltransferase